MIEELMAKVEQIMAETGSKRDGAIIQLAGAMSFDERKAFCDKFDLDYTTEPREQSTSMRDGVEGQIIAWFDKRDRMAQIAAKQARR